MATCGGEAVHLQRTNILLIPDAGKDGGQKQKKASEDEMAGWHHRCNGHELGQTSGDGEGQGGLAAVHGVTKSQS